MLFIYLFRALYICTCTQEYPVWWRVIIIIETWNYKIATKNGYIFKWQNSKNYIAFWTIINQLLSKEDFFFIFCWKNPLLKANWFLKKVVSFKKPNKWKMINYQQSLLAVGMMVMVLGESFLLTKFGITHWFYKMCCITLNIFQIASPFSQVQSITYIQQKIKIYLNESKLISK